MGHEPRLVRAHGPAGPALTPGGSAWVGGPGGILVTVLFVVLLVPIGLMLLRLVEMPFALLGARIAAEP